MNKIEREIACVFCDSTDVELFSLYGQTLLGSQYYCRSCKAIFEAIRFDDEESEDELSDDKVAESYIELNLKTGIL